MSHTSKITRSAKGHTCVRCGAPGAYCCHYNGPHQHTYGKGMRIKGHDLASAEFCHECDMRFTEGSTSPDWPTIWDRSDEFLHWIMLTNIRRFERGDLVAV